MQQVAGDALPNDVTTVHVHTAPTGNLPLLTLLAGTADGRLFELVLVRRLPG